MTLVKFLVYSSHQPKEHEMSLSAALNEWTNAIEGLDWGVQRVLFDALQLVASDDIKMTYAADVMDGTPCLLNAVSAITVQSAHQTPGSFAPNVVNAFDSVNRELFTVGVNEDAHRVSPLAAEVLLRHFGPLKDAPADTTPVDNRDAVTQFIEPTDKQMAEEWIMAQTITPPSDVVQLDEDGEPINDSLDAEFSEARRNE